MKTPLVPCKSPVGPHQRRRRLGKLDLAVNEVDHESEQENAGSARRKGDGKRKSIPCHLLQAAPVKSEEMP